MRVVLGLGLVLVILFVIAILMYGMPHASPLVPPPGRYAAIVERIRGLHLAAGQRRRFRLANPADPATLREDTSRYGPGIGKGAGTVWVETDAAGKLLVAIETDDQGHAGEFGYLFADAGALGPDQRDSSVEGPGLEWTLDRSWGGGWWSVSYRLG